MGASAPQGGGKSAWLFWVLGGILVLVAAAAVYAMLNTTTWLKGDAMTNEEIEDMNMMAEDTMLAGDQMEGDMVGGDANVSGDVNIPPPPPGLPGGPTN